MVVKIHRKGICAKHLVIRVLGDFNDSMGIPRIDKEILQCYNINYSKEQVRKTIRKLEEEGIVIREIVFITSQGLKDFDTYRNCLDGINKYMLHPDMREQIINQNEKEIQSAIEGIYKRLVLIDNQKLIAK